MTYILLTKTPPFNGNGQRLYDNIRNRTVDFERFAIVRKAFENLQKGGEPAKDFIRKCLEKKPSARPTAEQLLKHEWILSGT